MRYKALLLVVFLLAADQTAQAKNLAELAVENSCSQSEISAEPIQQRKIYIDAKWVQIFSTPVHREILEPKQTRKLYLESGYVHKEVSISHIVNLLSEGFKAIQAKEAQLISEGKLDPIVEGKTYANAEYQKRLESTAKFKKEILDPMLAELHRVYIDALVRDQEKRKNLGKFSPVLLQAFYDRVEQQRKILNAGLAEVRPEITQKIGEIVGVSRNASDSLPFSYRDGVIVKIRFKRKDSDRHVTLYPRMILNQVSGADDFFLKALETWKTYCHDRWQESKGGSLSFLTKFLKDSSQENLMKAGYDQAVEAYQGALWVHEEAKKLSLNELASLMDLFRQLRFEDYPQCPSTLRALNANMRASLQGQSSSASPKLSDVQRKVIEEFGKDVVFYQDIYSSFSEMSAYILSWKARTP